MTDSYVASWHRRHSVCSGWDDAATFAAAIGERPPGHGLARTDGDVAACGACEDCLAVGAACNVTWIAGARARAPAVPCQGEMVSQAEAGRRLGLTRAAIGWRLAHGIPLDAVGGETGRYRGKGRTPKSASA